MAVTEFTGVDKVLANLNMEIKKIEGNISKGLPLAALHVRAKAQEYAPIDEGNLRASAFTIAPDKSVDDNPGFKGKQASGMGTDHALAINENKALVNNLTAVVGFSAYYAVYVHEIDKNYKAPGVSWKFLEKALTEEQKEVLKIIARKAKI